MAELLDDAQHPQDLVALPAVGEDANDVARADGPEVAMQCFSGIEKMTRRASAGKRGGEFARDVPRLADAAREDGAGAIDDQTDGAVKAVVQSHRLDGGRLDLEHLLAKL